jgi:hypothetical protein
MSGNYVVPVNNLYVAQYFKSANQTLASGSTDITFDREQPWNNSGSYITHTSGTTNFVVNKTGLYQLEWNVSIFGINSTSTDLLKQISIDITRSPIVEQVTITQNASIPTARNYGQSVSASFYLVVGDVINCRVVNTHNGPASVIGLTNTFDLNTWFMWKYIG